MFTAYVEKEAFENIVLWKEKTPNSYKIFCDHSYICLNITKDDLIIEQVQGTPIFEFIMANGGRSPVALKEYFDLIYEDNSVIADKPRSIYFLDVSKEKAKELTESFGVIVQHIESIDDEMLKGTHHRELVKGSVVETAKLTGWDALCNFNLPPSNSIIVADDYLFSNVESSIIVGEVNLIAFVGALLPKKLNVPYHILIIARDLGNHMTKQRCEKLAGDLKTKLKALRPYDINLELVLTEAIHKRKAFLNYLSITCDKGFSMFRINDLKTVRDDNDFRYERIFNRINPDEGDSVFVSDTILLEQVKAKCKDVTEYINNRSQDPGRRILGDCNADKSIKNRLINDV